MKEFEEVATEADSYYLNAYKTPEGEIYIDPEKHKDKCHSWLGNLKNDSLTFAYRIKVKPKCVYRVTFLRSDPTINRITMNDWWREAYKDAVFKHC